MVDIDINPKLIYKDNVSSSENLHGEVVKATAEHTNDQDT